MASAISLDCRMGYRRDPPRPPPPPPALPPPPPPPLRASSEVGRASSEVGRSVHPSPSCASSGQESAVARLAPPLPLWPASTFPCHRRIAASAAAAPTPTRQIPRGDVASGSARRSPTRTARDPLWRVRTACARGHTAETESTYHCDHHGGRASRTRARTPRRARNSGSTIHRHRPRLATALGRRRRIGDGRLQKSCAAA